MIRVENMRVAIDAGPLSSGHKVRGVGFYTKSLIDSLQALAPTVGRLKIDAFDFAAEPKKLETGVYDVIHYPYFNPYIIPYTSEKFAKTIVTIHDVIPLLYPEHYPPGFKGAITLKKHIRLLSTVDAVITDTESSKKDIVRLLGISEKKVMPIYLAPRSIFKPYKDRKLLSETQKKYNLPNKFVLYVGDVNYNKNISTLVKACDIADVSLVLVGKQAAEITDEETVSTSIGLRDKWREIRGQKHPEVVHLEELKEMFKKSRNIYRLGFVPDEDLVAIFNLATVYCQPSLYEGFGLGPLEAMASGTAVVNSKTQALMEVADEASLYSDPRDAKEMAQQIEKIVNDAYVRAMLIRQGEKRVAEFSWEKTARETYNVYQKVFQDERIHARRKKL